MGTKWRQVEGYDQKNIIDEYYESKDFFMLQNTWRMKITILFYYLIQNEKGKRFAIHCIIGGTTHLKLKPF